MASLSSLLPRPQHARVEVIEAPDTEEKAPSTFEPPPYRQRKVFVPRSLEDFGDGGAFPEIHVLQYPLDMGRKDKPQMAVVPLKVDAEGNIKYDLILRQGARAEQKIYSQYTDLVEKDVAQSSLAKPTAEEEAKTAERTGAALDIIIDASLAAAAPTKIKSQNLNEPVFVRYTPSQAQQGDDFNSGAKQRVIRLQEMPVDPLEPPKFKHKKVPGGPPSPPVPVMHSPPRKITVADQQNWKIPPCVSNWKNIKGYTVPLDKRLAADGRGLQEVQINDKFAKLSESLFVAERTARKEISLRADMQKQVMKKQKEARDEELLNKAKEARNQVAAGVRARETEEYTGADEPEEPATAEDLEGADEREALRRDRRRELQREYRIDQIKNDKRKVDAKGSTVLQREKERDVSEKIALGQTVATSKESMFDQRLFNQAESSAAGLGDDEAYNVYDKSLFKGSSASFMYRPSADIDTDMVGGGSEEGLKSMLEKSSSKFTGGDRGFKGTDEQGGRARDKPVQFEKDQSDPFGFLTKPSDQPAKAKALDGIGKAGTMSAFGGGASRGDDLSRKHEGKTKDFQEGISSSGTSTLVGGLSGGSKSSSSSKRAHSQSRSRSRSPPRSRGEKGEKSRRSASRSRSRGRGSRNSRSRSRDRGEKRRRR